VKRRYVKERELGNICFHVTRVQRGVTFPLAGEDTDPAASSELEEEEDEFSYTMCFKSVTTCEHVHLYRAFRTAVMDDVQAFGEAEWNGKDEIICPISGLVTKKEDHPVRFSSIMQEFLDKFGKKRI